MEATLIVRHRQYTDAFFRNLSARCQPQQESPVLVTDAASESPAAASEPRTTSAPQQFDDLYLSPTPVAAEPELQSEPPVASLPTPIPSVPTIPTQTAAVQPAIRFEKPILPPIQYSKKQWTLHQHEDLLEKIASVRKGIDAEAGKRNELLAQELAFFEKVNQAEKALRDVMMKQDQRQMLTGVCFDLRKVVVECLKTGKDCKGEIAGWKDCERNRK